VHTIQENTEQKHLSRQSKPSDTRQNRLTKFELLKWLSNYRMPHKLHNIRYYRGRAVLAILPHFNQIRAQMWQKWCQYIQ